MLDPLSQTGRQWEPKTPVDTITARLLMASVKEMLDVRQSYLHPLKPIKEEVTTDWKQQRKLKRAQLKAAYEFDQLWLFGQGDSPECYTLESFCTLFKVRPDDVRHAYNRGDRQFFDKLEKLWFGCVN